MRHRWKRRLRRLPAKKWLAAGFVLTIPVLALAASCGGPPKNPHDLCAVFDEKRSWYRATRRSFKDWGVPEAIQMAVIYQESGFRRKVRPPRRKILWIFPGPRPSSAYGYAQVVEPTWRDFQESTGRRRAERDDFADVAHFLGWYGDHIHRATGVAKHDAFRLYLAYHEGPRGYARGDYRGKPALLAGARSVATRASLYQRQYMGCRKRLANWWIFW